MVAISTPSLVLGAPPFKSLSGVGGIVPPHWGVIDYATIGFSTTATRLYYIPYYFSEIVTFTGLKMRNGGTGDNGEVLRLGAYQATTPNGGLPTSLIVDAGEITLTGAAADRTLASSWTTPYVGWGFLAYHANTAAQVVAISTRATISNVGQYMPNPATNVFGLGSLDVNSTTASGFGAYYVDTTYTALASTAVAPTGIVTVAPVVAPYRT